MDLGMMKRSLLRIMPPTVKVMMRFGSFRQSRREPGPVSERVETVQLFPSRPPLA